MSPRNMQFGREDIIEAAFALVRKKGWDGFSVTAVAKAITSSTMPIYSQFTNVRELEDAVCLKALELLKERMLEERTGDKWIDQAISYVRFAEEEKYLFRCMWDGRNVELCKEMGKDLNEFISHTLVDYPLFEGLDELELNMIRLSRMMFAQKTGVLAECQQQLPRRKKGFRILMIISAGRPWRSMTASGCSSSQKKEAKMLRGNGWKFGRFAGVIGFWGVTVLTVFGSGLPAAAAGPEHGGTLTVAVEADSRGFDPIKAGFLSAQARSAAMAIEERLFDMDAKGKLVPELGLSASPSKDGKSWTIKLRKGVSFHDGTPFNADAVVEHWERLLDPKNHYSRAGHHAADRSGEKS